MGGRGSEHLPDCLGLKVIVELRIQAVVVLHPAHGVQPGPWDLLTERGRGPFEANGQVPRPLPPGAA